MHYFAGLLLPGLLVFVVVRADNMVDDLPRRLLNGFIRRINNRPAPVLANELPDIFHVFKDLFEIAVARIEPGIFLAHLPHLLEDLWVNGEADDLVLVYFKELLGQGDSRDDGNIGDLEALLGQVKRGRGRATVAVRTAASNCPQSG